MSLMMESGETAVEQDDQGEVWIIFFINDLHGRMDGVTIYKKNESGYPVPVKVGGINSILKTIEQQIYTWECDTTQSKRYVICLGGDIFRRYTSRHIDEVNFASAYEYLVRELEKDGRHVVYVLGNHELDFRSDAISQLNLACGDGGCTRNVDWHSSVTPPHGASEKCRLGGILPRFSSRVCIHGSDCCLLFTGAVVQTERIEPKRFGPFQIHNSDTFGGTLENLCLSNPVMCAAANKRPIVVHLAHYPDEPPRAFSERWQRMPKKPVLCLKGHDHNPTESDLGLQQIDLDNLDNPVPTYEAERDGVAIGELYLRVTKNKAYFRWQLKVPQNPTPWEPPKDWGGPSPSPVVVSNVQIPRFGDYHRDPDSLYRAVNILLASMLSVYSDKIIHAAISSPLAIREYSFVPESEAPVATAVDEFDLRNVYGGAEPTFVYECTASDSLAHRLICILQNPGLKSCLLPPCSDPTNDKEQFLLANRLGAGYRRGRALCVRYQNRFYLLTYDLKLSAYAFYRVCSIASGSVERRKLKYDNLETFLQQEGITPDYITMSSFTRRLAKAEKKQLDAEKARKLLHPTVIAYYDSIKLCPPHRIPASELVASFLRNKQTDIQDGKCTPWLF